MQDGLRYSISNMVSFLVTIVFTLLFISMGVITSVNFRQLYYFDVDYLNIAETSGLDKKLSFRITMH
jgi:hypothetical protein